MSRVFKGERAELEELCLEATCLDEQQLRSLLGASAACVPATAVGTPGGSSAPVGASTDGTSTAAPPESDTVPTSTFAPPLELQCIPQYGEWLVCDTATTLAP